MATHSVRCSGCDEVITANGIESTRKAMRLHLQLYHPLQWNVFKGMEEDAHKVRADNQVKLHNRAKELVDKPNLLYDEDEI